MAMMNAEANANSGTMRFMMILFFSI